MSMLTLPTKNEAHVFLTSLTATPTQQQTCLQNLNEQERERAYRFLSPLHQERFIIAHGVLRLILSWYLQIPPAEIAFSHNEYKKPYLSPAHALKFNLSHSDDMAVYAFTTDNEVGIDIEKIQPQEKMELAERFFSEQEVATLKALPDEERIVMFYRFWSKKEAILKASGKGLNIPLKAFSVSTGTDAEKIEVIRENWSVSSLPLLHDYAMAIATAEPITHLNCWDIINLEPVVKSMT